MTVEQIYRIFQAFPKVLTDSRKVEKGTIFFALKGQNFNGNKFASDALEKGAAFAVIDEIKYHQKDKTILVDNVLEMLQRLAHFHRKKINIPIIAITGSNGKTTTKELIASVLARKYTIRYTQGNLNNHIGVPLTLLEMSNITELGVVEMGASHPGEIACLCSIADPDFGIITNIGRAHLEGFGSFETIKKTKAELFSYLKKKNGTVFFNYDNPVLTELTKKLNHKVSFGKSGADLKGELLKNPPYIHVKAQFPKGTYYLKTKLIGNYNFENVMAAACIGDFFGVAPEQIQEAVSNYQPGNNRSQLIEKNHLQIVMDAYNANPTSMQASINSFVSNFPNPKYLILGDMLELGSESMAEHLTIMKQINKESFTEVFLVGPFFSKAAKNFPLRPFKNTNILCSYLAKNPLKKGSVLIKGSRGIQLEKVLDFL